MHETDDRLPRAIDTIVIYSDLHCSFAHLAIHQMLRVRTALGLDGHIWFDHRAFPLELHNQRVNSLRGVNSEVAVIGALDPDAGWQLWQAPDWEYPVSVLLPMEAVQAAKQQCWAAGEELDRGLRTAFWKSSRCISMRHVIDDVAAACPSIDHNRLFDDLDRGTWRHLLFEQFAQTLGGLVNCSPHIFLWDGTDAANPGVTSRWINGPFGVGYPVIEEYDRTVYQRLLTRAADLAGMSVSG
ncbi:dithiol-disulfide isomerase [Nocardia sp. NPDC050175]|uniref:dithiol-disulfide isomerase n=1 Tax=Nocardia sp. NPDC050175 TaxID=3364317 RepID=UPI0037B329D1